MEVDVVVTVNLEVVVCFVVGVDVVGFVVEPSFVVVVASLVWDDVELCTVEDEIGEETVELGRGPLLPTILTSAHP